MLENPLQHSLDKGATYLIDTQDSNGGFISYSSPDSKDFRKVISFRSTFSTAVILQIVSKLPETNSLTHLKRMAAAFLLSQKTKLWTWNYWDRNSEEYLKLPYPDDLDDTFCALTGLYLYKHSLINGKALGHATQVLTSLEVNEGGPYRTWLVNEDATDVWRDIDLGVNANIAYFLSLQGITLPKLTNFFDQAIQENKFITPYYPTPFSTLYFLARFIKGTKRRRNLKQIIMKLKPSTSLEYGLKIAALLYLKAPASSVKVLVTTLILQQNQNGSWNPSGFYTGVNPKKDKKFYAGSHALTTAICLEAINLYKEKILKKTKEYIQKKQAKRQLVTWRKEVLERVDHRFKQLGIQLQLEACVYKKKVLSSDTDMQITLLPFMFYRALNFTDKDIPIESTSKLGSASLYGWIAYTIYDNFLDEEAKISSLPLANICLREITTLFYDILPNETGFQDIFKKTMDQLEEVNTWEVSHCRFNCQTSLEYIKIPDYKNYQALADRSMGHALGCVAILMSFGYKKDSREVTSLLNFFSHYLIARQLNDDAHDWEKDLKMGQINSVSALLLAKAKTDLEKVFWYEIVDDVCDLITSHVTAASESLAQIEIIRNPTFLYKMIAKQAQSVTLIKEERKKALSFLATYSSI